MTKKNKFDFKKHLLTAISYLIPIVCGAGFLIAIGFAFSGEVIDLSESGFGFFDALASLGASALGLLPVVISTGISFSIAGKPGVAPGFIVGLAANSVGAGFIGGILGGYIAGFIALWIIKNVKVPKWAQGLMPTLIVPFLSSLVAGLIMVYLIGFPIKQFTMLLTNFLSGLTSSSKGVLGAIIGALSGIDLGGPINKTVFAFVLTLQAEGINEPITALQLVNTATPIGFGFAYLLSKLFKKDIFKENEVETLKSAVPMGVVNIVEGVIPIVLNDIVRSVIAIAIGGMAGGIVSLTLGADATVPFGGVLMIPTMSKPLAGILAILVNTVVTGVALVLLKKRVEEDELDYSDEEAEIDDIEIII